MNTNGNTNGNNTNIVIDHSCLVGRNVMVSIDGGLHPAVIREMLGSVAVIDYGDHFGAPLSHTSTVHIRDICPA